MKTNDTPILDLMKDIGKGKIQLPDFQRGWVWDDNRIRGLIASITQNFPVGAAMFLEYGNDNVRFKYRMIEGAPPSAAAPEQLILDGQQRLTSIYAALCSPNAVKTKTDRGNAVNRFYYIDIAQAVDPSADRADAIISVPESKQITSDFGRKVELDVSSAEKEYENKLFPLNIILDDEKSFEWEQAYLAYHNNSHEVSSEYRTFRGKIIMPVTHYKIPVISLDKDTPKEAVCQVFENVNQGGVSLTVFELVTAVFAMDDFELRADWDKRKVNDLNGDVLNIVTATDFLTACTLLSSYEKKGTVSCKKKDVLGLKLVDYNKYADLLTQGFQEAELLLAEECIFVSRDLPYTTQLIPLAVLCALLLPNHRIKASNVRNKIKQWYWCGVFGELYGSANETRYVNDVVGVMSWLGGGDLPKTVVDSYFNPMRLLMLQSRRSAAYKGIMALVMKNHSRDFISGQETLPSTKTPASTFTTFSRRVTASARTTIIENGIPSSIRRPFHTVPIGRSEVRPPACTLHASKRRWRRGFCATTSPTIGLIWTIAGQMTLIDLSSTVHGKSSMPSKRRRESGFPAGLVMR